MIPPIDRSQLTPRQQESTDKPAISKVDKISAVAQIKAELNVSILESAKVNIGAKDNSLTLLFNAAIDKINEQLAPSLGEGSIQKAYDEGLDVSPEATAERIVSLSTVSYQAYKQSQGTDEAESVVLDRYIDLLSSGVDQGFGEARTILDGLDVLEGDIASNIDKTYALVIDKLEAFKQMILEQSSLTNEAATDSGA